MRPITITHISNDYCYQKLYSELVRQLSKLGIRQNVFTPARSEDLVGSNQIYNIDDIGWHYSRRFRFIHKILFSNRIAALFSDLMTGPLSSRMPDIVHAHTLFSDGAIALKMKNIFNFPFIVTVRNTDINHYFHYRPDLWNLGYRILEEAAAIVFITPSYKEKISKFLPAQLNKDVIQKSHVIPNGVSNNWLLNQRSPLSIPSRRILSVSDFSRNKNSIRLIKAFLRLNHPDASLTLVGGGGAQGDAIRRFSSRHPGSIQVVHRQNDQNALMDIFRRHDVFALPSIHETFGLVYIEALSQGLPILCAQGEGVSGYFRDHPFCRTVDPLSVNDIAVKLDELLNFKPTAPWPPEHLQDFSWGIIGEQYRSLYYSVI